LISRIAETELTFITTAPDNKGSGARSNDDMGPSAGELVNGHSVEGTSRVDIGSTRREGSRPRIRQSSVTKLSIDVLTETNQSRALRADEEVRFFSNANVCDGGRSRRELGGYSICCLRDLASIFFHTPREVKVVAPFVGDEGRQVSSSSEFRDRLAHQCTSDIGLHRDDLMKRGGTGGKTDLVDLVVAPSVDSSSIEKHHEVLLASNHRHDRLSSKHTGGVESRWGHNCVTIVHVEGKETCLSHPVKSGWN